jgi:hypothetical protein
MLTAVEKLGGEGDLVRLGATKAASVARACLGPEEPLVVGEEEGGPSAITLGDAQQLRPDLVERGAMPPQLKWVHGPSMGKSSRIRPMVTSLGPPGLGRLPEARVCCGRQVLPGATSVYRDRSSGGSALDSSPVLSDGRFSETGHDGNASDGTDRNSRPTTSLRDWECRG